MRAAGPTSRIGVIGGSGVYDIAGLQDAEWRKISTPFGDPSDELLLGKLEGRDVAFLPRHRRGHRLAPHEINHRANVWALKSIGVNRLISISAVGSLQERYKPLDMVFPGQFLDRTKRNVDHTFFGNGIVAHISFADPVCRDLQRCMYQAAKAIMPEGRVHLGGTYVNMEGPAFSTRAESETNHKLGFDIIGMTNLAEAKLAREAEICYTSLAMVTDYDCWKTDEEPVTADLVIQRLQKNAENARRILKAALPKIAHGDCGCHHALKHALVTDRKHWPSSVVQSLEPLLSKYL